MRAGSDKGRILEQLYAVSHRAFISLFIRFLVPALLKIHDIKE